MHNYNPLYSSLYPSHTALLPQDPVQQLDRDRRCAERLFWQRELPSRPRPPLAAEVT